MSSLGLTAGYLSQAGGGDRGTAGSNDISQEPIYLDEAIEKGPQLLYTKF